MAKIVCGNCKSVHESVNEVRACYGSSLVADRMEAGRPDLFGRQAQEDAYIVAHPEEFGRDDVRSARRRPYHTSHPAPEPCTDRQWDYIVSLRSERDTSGGGDWLLPREELSKDMASRHIKALKNLPKRSSESTSSGAWPKVPAGYYATTSRTGNNDLDFWCVQEGTGRWEGRTFVKRVIGGRPEVPVRGKEARTALETILADGPESAAVLYGRTIGRCYVCNRTLTDEESRRLGIGPVCRGG